jgi:hypothetical protein
MAPLGGLYTPAKMGRKAMVFVKSQGIVLQAARGRAPNLAEFVAGAPIRGSWWGHPRGKAIFDAANVVVDSGDVLVCRLVGGKVTFVHRRLWPALVRLADRLPEGGLDQISEEHTPSGRHERRVMPFPEWVPADVAREARRLSEAEAKDQLASWPWLLGKTRAASSIRPGTDGNYPTGGPPRPSRRTRV